MVVPQRSPIDSEHIESRYQLKSGLDRKKLEMYIKSKVIAPVKAPRGETFRGTCTVDLISDQ
jgi:hypothetical protein